MKEIPLTQGKVALVDDEDFERLNQFKWYVNKIKSKYSEYFYASTRQYGRKVPMHRIIMNTPAGLVVDHINHNTLDCQKTNMRNVSHAQNIKNQFGHKNKPSRTSQYKGVCWGKAKKKWRAQITINRKVTSLGDYEFEIDAHKRYISCIRALKKKRIMQLLKNRKGG